MSLQIEELSHDQLGTSLAHHLKCLDAQEPCRLSLISEHLRAAIYAHSMRVDDRAQHPGIRTQRLMTNLTRNLDGVCLNAHLESDLTAPSEHRDVYLDTLRCLADLGDVWDTGGGLWISTPVRLIGFEDPDDCLVLGGVPNEAAELTIGSEIVSGGVGRFTAEKKTTLQARNGELLQSFDTWLGAVEPLSAWTKRTIAEHVERLSSVQEIAADHVEIYAPDVFRLQKKLGFWLLGTNGSSLIAGPRIFRPIAARSFEFNRPYYLGTFLVKGTELVLQRSVALGFETSRRLRFGFDELLGVTRTVDIKVDGNTFVIERPYGLPEREARVLSLGWRPAQGPAKGRELLQFHRSALPALLHAFKQLLMRPVVTTVEHEQ